MNKKHFIITVITATVLTCACAIAHEGFDKANFEPRPFPPHHKHFKGRPNPEVMKQRKLEFEQKLQLTDEQKAKLKKNHEKSREKMKKIMEKERKLKEEKQKIMREDKEYFESVLTDKQKETLKNMHEEQIKKWKEKKEQLKNKKEEAKKTLPAKPKKSTK